MTDSSPTQSVCPHCGSSQIQGISNVSQQTYDVPGGVLAGLLGAICLGPIGLICALCGIQDKKKTTFHRMCLNCGHNF